MLPGRRLVPVEYPPRMPASALTTEPADLRGGSPAAAERRTRVPVSGKAILVWVAGAVAIALLSWHALPLVPAPGLDNSWGAGLHMAAHDGITFGDHLNFTYGPLGFLDVTTLWYDSTGTLAFAYGLGVRIALALALFVAARRSYGLLLGWLVALIVASVVTVEIAGEVAVVFILAVWALQRTLEWRSSLMICCLVGAIGGVTLLGKESTGVAICVMAVILVFALPRRTRANAAGAGASFVGAFLAGWFGTGQSLAALPSWFHNVAELLTGYASAMQYEEPLRGLDYAAAVILFGLGLAAAVYTTEALPRRARWGIGALWVTYAFLIFKEGFVRHDTGHAWIFFDGLLAALVAFRWSPGRRYIGVGITATALVVTLGAQGNSLLGDRGNPGAALDQIRQVSSASARRAIMQQGRALVETADRLDASTLAAVRGRRVAVWPYELALAWAYRLSWSPLPNLQAYSAYTAGLDTLDVRALSSSRAPERMLYRYDPGFDGRVPPFDEPATSRTILCRYRELHTTPMVDVLARSAQRCSDPTLLAVVRADWGQSVAVPAPPTNHSMVLVRIGGVSVAGFEQIRGLLYKPRLRYLVLDGIPHRLIVGTAGDGLPLRAAPGMDFRAPFNIATGSTMIAVTKDAQEPTGGRPITFSFYVQSFTAGPQATAAAAAQVISAKQRVAAAP